MIEEGGLDALDALAFRISGSGERVAEAFEAKGDAPELVIMVGTFSGAITVADKQGVIIDITSGSFDPTVVLPGFTSWASRTYALVPSMLWRTSAGSVD